MPDPLAIVVVGASLAGLRVAEQLRRNGHDGPLHLVGDEPHLPYNRPPLSKQVLSGEWEPDRTALTDSVRLQEAEIEVRMGARAVAADTEKVLLEGGESIGYDRLVVATGAAARPFPGTTPGSRIHHVRTLADSIRLREAIGGGGSVLVVGGGFVGLEVASVARLAGCSVTVVEAGPALLAAAVGTLIGGFFARLHEDHGVCVLLQSAVAGLQETGSGVRARLADGTVLRADHAVVGIGARANTGWLAGLGLDLPAGLPCDEQGRVEGFGGRVWAIGDVARWRDARFGDQVTHEHWTSATEQAATVGAALLGIAAPREQQSPYFWSNQYDVNFQLAGRPDLADEVVVLEPGEEDGRGTIFELRRAGAPVGFAAFHNPRRFMALRRELAVALA